MKKPYRRQSIHFARENLNLRLKSYGEHLTTILNKNQRKFEKTCKSVYDAKTSFCREKVNLSNTPPRDV